MRRIAKYLFSRLPWHWRQAFWAARTFLIFRKPVFSGVYDKFEDAPGSGFYDSNAWADASAVSTKANRANPDLPSAGSRALLPAALALMSGPVKVLDFGGATGIDFAIVAAQNTSRDLSYTVIDTPAACEAGRAIWSDDERISFLAELPEAAKFDVVYSCVSIHTVSDPLSILRKFTEYEPRIVLLARHPFADKAFVRGQVNMARPLPQWVLSLPDVTALMAERGYELRMNIASEDNYNVENFSAETAVGGTRNLMFVRQ
jgi:putative methyltransferase (TIGR04325 family)